MSVTPMFQERRCRRSQETYRAITFQLEHVLRLHGLRNFTLSDANGLVLASAGLEDESRALAAYAPVLAKCLSGQRRAAIEGRLAELVPMEQIEGLSMRSFFVDGQRLFLCLVGQQGGTLDSSLYRALTGIRRIYHQSMRA